MSAADNSVLKSTGIMTIATLLSRASGLLRTWAMAFALGNTLITSSYQVANSMPNFIFELVAGGILGTAFLPVYLLQREKQGREGSDRFASNILNISLIVLGGLAVLATIFAPQVIATQTFTVSAQTTVFETAVTFFRIFAIQIVFYGLGGVITGVLNANRVYGLPALAPVFNNVIVIISMFAYVPLSAIDSDLALLVLGIGTSLGVIAQFGIQIPTLVKTGFRYTLKINFRDPALKEALRIAFPTLIYIIGTLISFSCRNAFSLASGDEGPATILYAWTWYQLPYGVVAVSISTAFLTEMSDVVARNDFAALRDYVKKGLRTTLFLIIPLAGMMFVLASPIIQIFRAGAFNQEDVVYVSSILSYWVVSLPFYAGLMYLYRVFAALRRFMTFALVSCGFCVVQIGLYAILCDPDVLGLIGIPVADLVYFGLMFITMAIILRTRIGSFEMHRIVALSFKVLVATFAGMALVYALILLVPLQQPSILTGLAEIVFFGGSGLLLTFGICKLLRVSEMDVVTNILKRVFRKIAKKDDAEGAMDGTQTHSSDADRTGFKRPSTSSPRLPSGKHIRPGSYHFLDEDTDEDSIVWNKKGKHTAASSNNSPVDSARKVAYSPAHAGRSEFEAVELDPSSTGAIKARARHVKP